MIAAYPRLNEAQQALQERRFVEAAELAMTHLRSHPRDARALGLLGAAAMRMGALRQAEQFLRQSLELQPSQQAIARELASCLQQQERLDEALELFEKLAEQNPEDTQIEIVIAMILDKLGRADEATQKLEALAARHPQSINVWLAYALNLRAVGRTDEAIQAYRRATEIDPERGDAWWGLASIKKNLFTDDDVAAMESALSIAVDISNLAPLRFALGRAWHARSEYEKAFNHYTEANRLWAESINYKADELTEEVDEARRLFDRSCFETAPVAGEPSNAPIFIVSLPRSGSTLLEQMLGSHAEIEPLGELPHVPALLRGVLERAMRLGITRIPEALRALSADDRVSLGREYLRRVALHRKTESARFTDKLPHNWSNTLLINQMLPNARIIDIRRNALDCCFANFTHSFTRGHPSSFALEHIGRAYSDYVRFMDHLDEAAPGLVHHIRYEELVEDPEPVLRRALDYLGLPWDDACLRFYESDRTVRTPSAEQVRRPLNREGIANWKPYEQWLGPLFDTLGPLARRDGA